MSGLDAGLDAGLFDIVKSVMFFSYSIPSDEHVEDRF